MARESQIRKRLTDEAAERSEEISSHGLIGYVEEYYPEVFLGEDEAYKNHTADIKVFTQNQQEIYKHVPCFVYSHGMINKGLVKNDRVWVEFINGDQEMPIVTAYYREPTQIGIFFNNLKFSVANTMNSIFGGF